MLYQAASNRYQQMQYRQCGNSGLRLPEISLGLWQNFGSVDDPTNFRQILFAAFDLGITHFDLANNYGPVPGSAETNFGKVLQNDFAAYRDELIVSTKAGYTMWDGPYGDWGSKKYLVASLHQSLKRMRLEYVDIFYHHRYDANTPLYETMSALDLMVRQGKALYVGISNYGPAEAAAAFDILKSLGTPCLIHQPKYSMFVRTPENGLLDTLQHYGVGCIPFSPLAQGLLTNKYLNGIPDNSRATKELFLKTAHITPEVIEKVRRLNTIALERNQSLAQMAVAWLLKDQRITSVLMGASSARQIQEAVAGLQNTAFSNAELASIEYILTN